MRYVDVSSLSLPDGWDESALAATKAVLRGQATIAEYEDIWRDLKTRLAKVLFDKCWFCETPITRSDNAVDHFRPKGKVSDAARAHVGYRWLAFSYINFRYACTFCNSRRIDVEGGTQGGKADRFPLVNEPARVYEVNVETLNFSQIRKTVRGEKPAILDPCDVLDWSLLGCKRENGQPCAAIDDAGAKSRVATSIDVYHLNHEPTCKQRHRTALQLLQLVADAKDKYDAIAPGDAVLEDDFADALERVVRMIKRDAPYSGEMIYLLKGQRDSGQPWIQHIIDAC